MRLRNTSVLVFLVGLAACAGQSQPGPEPGPAAQTSAATAANAAAANNAEGVRTVTGAVLETMDAASYTYVKVKTAEGEIWAATGQFPVAVGDRVSVPLQMAMKDFRSPTLKRDFPVIYFVTHIDREGQPASSPTAAMAAPMMPAHGPSPGAVAAGAAQPAAASHGPVAPVSLPPGGTSIADVWAKRASLSGKTVTVRGQVVKFNGGILDRNWMHIQDGTGDARTGSHDLTVTSNGVAKVGDIITATGKVSVDRDFGAGYAYKVILEGATIAVK